MCSVDVEVGGQPAGLRSRTKPQAKTRREPWLGPLWSHRRQPMARSLWICLRRQTEERQEDDKRGGGVGKGADTG